MKIGCNGETVNRTVKPCLKTQCLHICLCTCRCILRCVRVSWYQNVNLNFDVKVPLSNFYTLYFVYGQTFLLFVLASFYMKRQSWPSTYDSWIYNYLCNRCLSVQGVQHYVIKFVSDLWQVSGFFPDPTVSFTNKTDCQDITEILLNVALNTIKPNQPFYMRIYASGHKMSKS